MVLNFNFISLLDLMNIPHNTETGKYSFLVRALAEKGVTQIGREVPSPSNLGAVFKWCHKNMDRTPLPPTYLYKSEEYLCHQFLQYSTWVVTIGEERLKELSYQNIPGDFITLRCSDKSYLIQGLSESSMCEHLWIAQSSNFKINLNKV